MASVPHTPTLYERFFTIVKVSRPPGWTFGPILFGIGLIHSQNIPKSLHVLFKAALQVFSYSFPLCTIVFGVNDVYDYASDIVNPRKVAAGLEGSVLAPVFHSDVLNAAYLSTLFIFVVSLLTRHPMNVAATTLILFFGWQYSSPPLRLKEIPILDSLSNGVIVFLCWLAGFSFSGKTWADAPTKGYMMALCTAGVHALGAVVDTESDMAAGQNTIAVFLGKRPAAIFGALCYLTALLTVESASIFGVYIWGGLLCMLPTCLNVHWAHRSFQFIVYWSVGLSVIWLGANSYSILSKITKRD